MNETRKENDLNKRRAVKSAKGKKGEKFRAAVEKRKKKRAQEKAGRKASRAKS